MTITKKAPPTTRKRRTTTTTATAKPRAPRKKKAVAPETPVEQPIAAAATELVAAPPPPPTTVIIQTVNPEIEFQTRHPGTPPIRPLPVYRRGVFFDVENTSRPSDVDRVLDHLGLDFSDRNTQFFAVGNWRVVGHETARLLASRGAQLVHSAPATGVRDWSDLRIAVSAGAWLAAARPGDMIQIVSDDQAFDAVGDVAMSLGVSFDRLSYRRMAGGVTATPVVVDDAPPSDDRNSDGRNRRRRRSGRRGSGGYAPERERTERSERPRASAPAPRRAAPPPPPSVSDADEAAEAASEAEIVRVVQQLHATSPNGVTLDGLSNALKAAGHRRPPGSLRLVTRVRRIKSLDVGRNGVIRLRDEGEADDAPAPRSAAIEFESSGYGGSDASVADEDDREAGGMAIDPDHDEDDDGGEGADADGAEGAQTADGQPTGARRRRRRGGRRRRGRGRAGNGVSADGTPASEEAPPAPELPPS